MSKSILIDTNILVYSCDSGEQARQEMAILLLRQLVTADLGRLSAQVLAEFREVGGAQVGKVSVFDDLFYGIGGLRFHDGSANALTFLLQVVPI